MQIGCSHMSKVLKQTHMMMMVMMNVTPGNKLVNFWNIFQHFLYKYKSTVKRHWDEHDNK